MKVWMRLGGFVEGSAEEIAKVNEGDTEMLIALIKRNGFKVDGDAYIPNVDSGEEVGFDLMMNLVEGK